MKKLVLALLTIALIPFAVHSREPVQFTAARSVHLGYPQTECDAFYLELEVIDSVPGSYFMACGWNTGYFGIQELGNGSKIAIFSVWDSSPQDNPDIVPVHEQTECLYKAEDVKINRFGGEGSGAQCLFNFNWQTKSTNKFLVTSQVQSNKTTYTGFIWLNDKNSWKKLVSFRTKTGGKNMHGLYSFIEDFRRDKKSVNEVRSARFFNIFVRTVDDGWHSISKARFTASNSDWESKDNIDAMIFDNKFILMTGGSIKQNCPIGTWLEINNLNKEPPKDLPNFLTRPVITHSMPYESK
jgi:hypothetical protein